VRLLRAKCYLHFGEVHSALNDLDKAISINGKDSELYLCRAEILAKLAKTDLAISDLNQAIALNPSAKAYFLRSSLYEESKQFAKAIKYFEVLVRLVPRKADGLYISQGDLYRALSKTPQAIVAYTASLKAKPSGRAYKNRGRCYEELKQDDAALKDYTEGIKLGPGDNLNYHARAMFFLATKQYLRAVQDFDQVIALNKRIENEAFCRRERAQAYARMGKLELAEQDRKKAQELDDSF